MINCHKIGLSKVKDGFDMWTNSWSNFSACLLGVDEQLVHIGVQCHKDQKFLGPSLPRTKRGGRIVTRTKDGWTKDQGTVGL